VFNPLAGSVVAVAGTSFASPLALRVAAGVDVLSGSAFDPVTLQALMINGCHFNSRSHSRPDVGWGRVPLDPEEILYSPQDVVRVVYQGVTRPGHPQKARATIRLVQRVVWVDRGFQDREGVKAANVSKTCTGLAEGPAPQRLQQFAGGER
jgi:hypothetical protein